MSEERFDEYRVRYQAGATSGTTPTTTDPKEAGRTFRRLRGSTGPVEATLEKRTVTTSPWQEVERVSLPAK